jgi:hypothetical protein
VARLAQSRVVESSGRQLRLVALESRAGVHFLFFLLFDSFG